MGITVVTTLQKSNMKNLCVFLLLACALAQLISCEETASLVDGDLYIPGLDDDDNFLTGLSAEQVQRLQKRWWFWHHKKVSKAFTWHPANDPGFFSLPKGTFVYKHRGLVKKVCKYGERVCNYLKAYNVNFRVVKAGCHSMQYVCEWPTAKRVAKVLVDAICTAAMHMCQYKNKIGNIAIRLIVKGVCWIVKKGCIYFEKKLAEQARGPPTPAPAPAPIPVQGPGPVQTVQSVQTVETIETSTEVYYEVVQN